MNRASSLFVVFPILIASSRAQWWFHPQPAGSPVARAGHALAYDPVRGYTLLFGGTSSAGVLADTWKWDGTSWTQLSPAASPNGRYDHAMAFDATLNAIVLFGGRFGSGSTQYLGDTWKWDGVNWVPILTTSSPSPRAEHCMAYHSALGSLVLFGGYGTSLAAIETWTLNQSGWTQVMPATNPPSRSSPSMTPHLANGRTVLYVSTGSANKFWEFTGTTWNVIPSPPTSVYECELTTSPDGHVIATLDSTTVANANLLMYKWSGSQWTFRQTNQGPTTPSGWFNRQIILAFDSSRNRSVMFSGVGAVNDTWEFADELFQASVASYGVGCGGPALTIAPSAGSRPLIGGTFPLQLSGTQSAFAWIGVGLSETIYGSTPLPIPLAGLGFGSGCSLYHDAVVLGIACTPTSAASASLTWPIPNQLSLLGFKASVQGYSFAPSEPGMLTFSNGLRLKMGNF